jgi:tRNA pseudouridine55 synthase
MKSGLILLNKNPGVTSFDALRDIKRSLATGKVGHTGTLDKFAQGLLIVLVGRALKLSQWFSGCDKQYLGKIHFGIETDTLDPEGCVTARADVPVREKVEQALPQFTGDIMQEPPAYSAIHVNGCRASQLARSGAVPQMKKRPVSIYRIELVKWEPPFAEIFVHCSSGTYIRSLARDIALAAGSRGHLCELLRTRIAGFSLDSVPFPSQYGENEEFNLRQIDKSVISSLGMPWFEISPQETEKIRHGKALDMILSGKPIFPSESCSQTAAVFCGESLAAIVEKNGSNWKYGCVFEASP